MRTIFFLLFAFSVSFFACSNDTTNSTNTDIKQYADFYIRYIAGERQIKAEAIFKKGTNKEKAIVRQPEGSIYLNQQKLKGYFLSKTNIRFQYEGTQALSDDNIFRFVKDDESTINYNLGLKTIKSFAIEGNASKNKGITITWKGDALSKEEEIVVLLTDQKSKAATHTFKNAPNNSITLSPDKLTKLTTGKGFLYLVRKRFGTETIKDLNIESLAEYYTDKIDVDIIE